MSQHSGPHHRLPPDDQRCEALVPGHPSYNWEWMRYDHRCPRKANQARSGRSVCYQHGAMKKVQFINGGSSVTKETIPSPREFDAPFKKLVGTFDLTPLWSELLPMMLEIYHTGNDGQRETLRNEFRRMAMAADAHVATVKKELAR